MPRTPTRPGHPLDQVVKVRLDSETTELLDRCRGDTAISEYVRQVVIVHLAAQLVGGFPRTDVDIARRAQEAIAERATSTVEVADKHRHKPGKFLAERTVKGVTTKTYRCAHEGCNHQMERRS